MCVIISRVSCKSVVERVPELVWSGLVSPSKRVGVG